jgi:hypothetical protein
MAKVIVLEIVLNIKIVLTITSASAEANIKSMDCLFNIESYQINILLYFYKNLHYMTECHETFQGDLETLCQNINLSSQNIQQ